MIICAASKNFHPIERPLNDIEWLVKNFPHHVLQSLRGGIGRRELCKRIAARARARIIWTG